MSNMTSHKEWIVDYIPLRLPICLGDDSVVYSAGVGKVWFEPLLSGHSAPLVCLSRVLHVPKLKSNLLSITYLSSQQQVKVSFINFKVMFEKNGDLIMEASINAHKVGEPCQVLQMPGTLSTAQRTTWSQEELSDGCESTNQ